MHARHPNVANRTGLIHAGISVHARRSNVANRTGLIHARVSVYSARSIVASCAGAVGAAIARLHRATQGDREYRCCHQQRTLQS